MTAATPSAFGSAIKSSSNSITGTRPWDTRIECSLSRGWVLFPSKPKSEIHPVISIAHLEPAPRDPDPYGRNAYPEPGPVAEWDEEDPPYEISTLLDRREAQIHEALYGAKELVVEYDEKHLRPPFGKGDPE
ncbi:uncharacterized protein BKCO1_1110002 [Diplodia corticola]|uniref:Uncharacterized protein n=1 Tax=Diplodia corticola TaxID=236234 RepID=A0A1J9QIW6_9PEZI|nr:uncharacterized protein BKCO1_1110002 [Diplodia corticola]OJD28798.1 hypothetical protein BKCO1_1110002 [Diplodia corticola]